MEECHQTLDGFRNQGEVERRRSGGRELDGCQVLGVDFDHHHVQPSVVGSISFVGARQHQTRGGADNPGEVGT